MLHNYTINFFSQLVYSQKDSLSLSLSLSLSHAHTYLHTHKHKHTLSITPTLTHTHTHTNKHTLKRQFNLMILGQVKVLFGSLWCVKNCLYVNDSDFNLTNHFSRVLNIFFASEEEPSKKTMKIEFVPSKKGSKNEQVPPNDVTVSANKV
jgi:hypothetical protein